MKCSRPLCLLTGRNEEAIRETEGVIHGSDDGSLTRPHILIFQSLYSQRTEMDAALD
jgi:hypothetical protein